MKKVTIKTITMENFKGVVKERRIELKGQNASIYGDNGTGKTTIADAFSWVLFGKDTDGKADFDIKPNGVDRPVVSAEIEMEVDGKVVKLKRELEETWAVSRVDGIEKYTGNKTIYYINDIVKSAGEFKAYVDSIASEDLFRRLSDARVFLSMKKQDMRKALIEMVGGISNDTVAADDESFKEIVQELIEKEYSPEDLQKLLKQNISANEAEQKGLQARIDEILKMLPEDQDWEKIEEGLSKGEQFLLDIDKKLDDAKNVMLVHSKIATVNERMKSYKAEAIRTANKERLEYQNQYERIKGMVDSLKLRLSAQMSVMGDSSTIAENIKTHMAELKAEYETYVTQKAEIEASEYVPLTEGMLICDKCGQELPKDSIEALNIEGQERFDISKKAELDKVSKQMENVLARAGQEKVRYVKAGLDRDSAVEQVEKIKDDIGKEESRLIVCKNKLESMPEIMGDEIDLTEDTVWQDLNNELKVLQDKVSDSEDILSDKLQEDKAKVMQQVNALRISLERKAEREKAEGRMSELLAHGKELAKEIAQDRKRRATVDRFLRKRAEMLEQTINSQFKTISFRLFEETITGELKDDCTPLVKGVEYASASHSEQIRANMEIVACMQKAHGILIPTFIDNAEACTWYVPMDCQVIFLVVSEQDKTLRIELEGEKEQ